MRPEDKLINSLAHQMFAAIESADDTYDEANATATVAMNYSSQQNADLKKELEEFKALVKEMRRLQGYSTFYPKRVECEQKVDKILGL